MKRYLFLTLSILLTITGIAQNTMTPELLWSLGRVSGLGVTNDGHVIYNVSTPNIETNKSSSQLYSISLKTGDIKPLEKNPLPDTKVSPDGKYMISHKAMKVEKVFGQDFYPHLDKSNVQIYDDLMIRHWDEWEDGKYDHVMLSEIKNGMAVNERDLMAGEPYNCPTKPFGGDDDYIWSPDGKQVIYVTKKKSGLDYAVSTNTDIYAYDLETQTTTNLTEGRMGYDVHPSYSANGTLAWLSMKRDGYESDKNDIIIRTKNGDLNLTGYRDDIHVDDYRWASSGTDIHFIAPVNGTRQLFEIPALGMPNPVIRQLTRGDFDITGIVGQFDKTLIVSRTDMNHATELYTFNLLDGSLTQLTHVNDEIYNSIDLCTIKRRTVKTTDNKDMLVWVIYPPNFDPNKKYPTLLYCQGGPQSALTQFYSFRWNFQLMASQGYIVVAPNRRGMPGHGTEWNESISKDHGGQVMEDYLSAIDAVSQDPYVDKDRLGCVGASYGGYSAFMLASMHKGRFKSFIAHDGIYDMRSMYGTTEELFFVDWDWGGNYWDKKNKAAKNNYKKFNPINFIQKWDTPILIIQGGLDFRVPIEQGLQAFQAAKLRGLNAKLLFFPEENHWILTAQNAMVWQKEFFNWLGETMPATATGISPGRS